MSDVVRAFLHHGPPSWEGDDEVVSRLVDELLERGRTAWPGISLDPAGFAAFIAARVGDKGEHGAADIRAEDLYITSACALEVPGAVEAFEAAYFIEVDRAAEKLPGSGLTLDDARQRIRERLFVRRPNGEARISEYAGRGSVRSWLRVLAVRSFLNARRDRTAEVTVDDSYLEDLAATADDPELYHLKARYQAEFAAAFEGGVGALEVRDRSLLRYSLVERLTVDQIGMIYGVHRATAARHVARARERLLDAVRAALSDRLGVHGSELQSIMRLAISDLHVTLSRILPSPR